MRNTLCLILFLALAAASPAQQPPWADSVKLPAEEKPIKLFNGKDLTGWEGDAKLWSAENGEIVGRSPGLKYNDFLASTERFGDFVLKFRFRLVNTIVHLPLSAQRTRAWFIVQYWSRLPAALVRPIVHVRGRQILRQDGRALALRTEREVHAIPSPRHRPQHA